MWRFQACVLASTSAGSVKAGLLRTRPMKA